MSRFPIRDVSLAVVIVGLALPSVVVAVAFGAEPAARPKAKVEFRWLESMPIPGVTEDKGIHTSESDDLSYPHKKPILTNADVVEVRVSKTELNMTGPRTEVYMLYFHLTPAARERLAASCGESGDKSLAAFVDGGYHGSPYYLKSRDKSTFVPYAGFFSEKSDMERIVGAFK